MVMKLMMMINDCLRIAYPRKVAWLVLEKREKKENVSSLSKPICSQMFKQTILCKSITMKHKESPTLTVVQGGNEFTSSGFCCVTIFQKDFTFGRKLVM